MVTLEETKVTLEEILPSRLCRAKKERDNTALSKSEINKLYQIVLDCENSTSSYTWQDWKKGLDKIASIGKKFNNAPQQVKDARNNSVILPTNPNKMPWLIKQVLFYAYADCCINDIKVTNKVVTATDIRDELKLKGLTLSHNFFSRTERAVNDYVSLETYVEPKAPFGYNGQKYRCLGYALGHLVYQAGKHDLFVDLFGGSGFSSVAFQRRRNSRYVYNEKDMAMYNLFYVMQDDKLYKKLIDRWYDFQLALRGLKPWISKQNLDNSANAHYSSSTPDEDYIMSCQNKVLSPSVTSLTNNNTFIDGIKLSLQIHKDDIIKKDSLLFREVDSLLNKRSKKYTNADILNYLNTANSISGLMTILFLLDEGYQYDAIVRVVLNYKRDLLDIINYNCYAYYYYFVDFIDNIQKNNVSHSSINDDDKVTMAVGTLYQSLTVTMGNKYISEILRMMTGDVSGKKEGNTNFLFKFEDVRDKLEVYHNKIKSSICTNDDFRGSIKLWSSKNNTSVVSYKNERGTQFIKKNNVLFYSDSPYLNTTGYPQYFSKSDMNDLICSLMSITDKFIFSCRAVVSGEKKEIAKIKKYNKEILDDVFKKFSDLSKLYSRDLYALVILGSDIDTKVPIPKEIAEKGGLYIDDIFIKFLKENKNIEVMITNYKITDFAYRRNDKVSFRVYPLDQFIDIVEQNANL